MLSEASLSVFSAEAEDTSDMFLAFQLQFVPKTNNFKPQQPTGSIAFSKDQVSVVDEADVLGRM